MSWKKQTNVAKDRIKCRPKIKFSCLKHAQAAQTRDTVRSERLPSNFVLCSFPLKGVEAASTSN